MKLKWMKPALFLCLFTAGISVTGCKSKKDNTTTTTTTTTTNTDQNNAGTSPEVAGDAELNRGVQDAIKDHPGVSATVNNGEITLSGTIEKDKWIQLKQTLDGLNPRKVNSDQLTVK